MGKKAREYKSGDFIFAKVKGYPAWPARVQRPNGKKYFVYFYGTGETANLPPNQIFDYAENKDKFLTKTVKRKDFNDGVRQIEHDFANNVPLEEVIGVAPEEPMDTSAANDTVNETADDSVLDTTADTSAAETTAADDTITTSQNEAVVEDSDEAGALVIDEGKKGRKSMAKPALTPKPVKEVKTPRGKNKKDDDEEKKEEEIISRSGRKIRPKRYIDEQTEENSTLPSPAPKKKRGASPAADKDKPDKSKTDAASVDKSSKHYNAVSQTELEELKEPFVSDDADKENLLIACLPSGQYIGIKLFQSRPTSYKNDAARLQWDKQAASNAITLKSQLEKGHITPQSVCAQLEMDLNLTDEEKANLDKEREIEEKKSRVQFLKTEMKLIELDAKIKSCLSLEKADTDLCLKLLDELMELDIKTLMLLKHPTCLETLKRMRAYVGNTPSWELSEAEALVFSKQAHLIRNKADAAYLHLKELFVTPDGLSFWEYFSERVVVFKKATAKLTGDERLEMVNEPLEMSMPSSHTMKSAIEEANESSKKAAEPEEPPPKKKSPPAKSKKAAATPSKPIKRQSSRTKIADSETNNKKDETPAENIPETEQPAAVTTAENDKESESPKDAEVTSKPTENASTEESRKIPEENIAESTETENSVPESEPTADQEKSSSNSNDKSEDGDKSTENINNKEKEGEIDDPKEKEAEKEIKAAEKDKKKEVEKDKKKDVEKDTAKDVEKDTKDSSKDKSEKEKKESNKDKKEADKDKKVSKKEADKDKKESSKDKKEVEKDKKESNKDKKEVEKDKKESNKDKKEAEKEKKESNKDKKESNKDKKELEKDKKDSNKDRKEAEKDENDIDKDNKETNKDNTEPEKEKEDSGEPKAKRGRENNKKTEPPKSPGKRKLRS